MRLAIFESAADVGQGNLRLGVVDGEQIHDATGAVPGLTSADLGSQGLGPVIAAWDQAEAALQDVAGGGDGMSLGDVQLRAPLRPTTIICCAGNYMEGEDRPKRPLNGFMKSPQAVIGPGDTVNLPPHDCSIFHHEAELALVVGRPAFRITEWEAASHVFGFTAFIDVSGRSWPPTNAGASFLGKSFHTFAPLGPVMVTADEVGDPQNLSVKLWVNDDLRQDYNTDDMEHPIPTVLAWGAGVVPLLPGDVIACGTNHHGLSPLQEGDVCRIAIENIGEFSVDVRDPLGRSWPWPE